MNPNYTYSPYQNYYGGSAPSQSGFQPNYGRDFRGINQPPIPPGTAPGTFYRPPISQEPPTKDKANLYAIIDRQIPSNRINLNDMYIGD
jgi:hypothetical protein